MDTFIFVMLSGVALLTAWVASKIMGFKEQIEDLENQFMTTTFSMLGKMAKADGVVSKATLVVVDQYMRNDLQFNEVRRNRAIKIFNDAKDSTVSFEQYAQQFYESFKEAKAIPQHMFQLLVRVASADGPISANRERLIASAVRIFQIDPYTHAQLRGFYFPGSASADSIDKHYAVLKCKPEDSIEEIKTKYRKLTMEYHPDRIQSKGLPEDFMKFSTQKFQEIQKAYETVKRERGF